MTTSRGKNPRGSSTICLPIRKEVYDSIVEDPEKFRAAVDQAFSDMPELFPKAFAQGYILKDSRLSRKLGMHLRRVECKASQEALTVRPSFVMPYMTALTDEVRKALYLPPFGVPFTPWPRSSAETPCTGIAWRSPWVATALSAPHCA